MGGRHDQKYMSLRGYGYDAWDRLGEHSLFLEYPKLLNYDVHHVNVFTCMVSCTITLILGEPVMIESCACSYIPVVK